jgi:hypothetical protein
MQVQHVVRRGAATAAGGSLVLGAGLALGVVVGRMQQDWLAVQAQRSAVETAQARAAVAAEPPAPVVVTEVRVRRVVPEPVVVHRTVTRVVAGQPAAAPRSRPARPAASQPARPAATPAAANPVARPSRTTVAPAPAPQRAQTPAPPATTSRTS